MKFNYEEIQKIIPFETYVYEEEGGYINILPDDYTKGSMLLEERDNLLIIWNTDLSLESYDILYETFKKVFDVPVYAVYIDTRKEYDALLKVKATPIDFDEQYDYPCRYGHFKL